MNDKPVVVQVVSEKEEQNVLDLPQSQDVPKNKVAAVASVLEGKKPNDADDDKGQEEYEDDKMYEEESNDAHVNKDSNQASEDEADAKPDVKPHILPQKNSLPPKDGSLVFRGPTNQKQKAVVDAFKHAWAGYKVGTCISFLIN